MEELGTMVENERFWVYKHPKEHMDYQFKDTIDRIKTSVISDVSVTEEK